MKTNQLIPLSLSINLLVSLIVLAMGFFVAAPTPTYAQSDGATEACKNSSRKTSCRKGYEGGVAGKTKSESCKGLSGAQKNACSAGYDKGKTTTANITGSPGRLPVSDIDSLKADKTPLPVAGAGDTQLDTMANIAFGIAGSLAMLFVVIGGVRYMMSTGDSQKVSQAKNTILYALIGLVVTVLAFAIVKFVIARIV